MRFLIMLVLSISFCAEISAQKELSLSKNQIGVNVVYLKSYFKDGHLSPLHYKGNAIGVRLNYIRQKTAGANLVHIKLGGNYGSASTSASKVFDANPIIGQLDFAYLFRLNKINQNLRFYLGPAYRFNAFVFLNTKFPVPAVSFLAAHELKLEGQVSIKIKEKNWIQARLSFPVLSSIIRPPYNVFNEYFYERSAFKILTDGRLSTWDKYQSLDWSVAYITSLSSRFDFKMTYRFQYNRIVEAQTMIYGGHEIGVGFSYKY